MDNPKKLVTLASIALVALGVITLVLNLALGGTMNVSWPLVVIMLGVVFFMLAGALDSKWRYAGLLYLPGSVLLALGLVFLLNVVTGDWNAWAYAWLLVLAGLGLGMVLVNRQLRWREAITLAGGGLIVGGLTLFVLFGALAGGRFILIMAPILLVAGGLALRWLRPELFLPKHLLKSLKPAQTAAASGETHPEKNIGAGNLPGTARQGKGASLPPTHPASPDQTALAEPLSPRELEVLRLVDQGLTNPQIAEKLTVAPSTVKTHINNIYGKLGVQGRLQAVNKAKESGLLSKDP